MSTDQSQAGIVPDVEGRLQQVVGENLRRVRSELGFSQESFGEHVGWHRTFVGAVERGERNLTLRTVERISDQLGVDPLELLWDRAAVAVRADRSGRVTGIGAPALAAADAPEGPRAPTGTPRRRPRPRPA
ncbi:MAG TPA: helix-turn-helix transcriptional regulator [Aquihabitans sp.]|nr:helix-turn-helix transcriptional regulator [Aquihabitans sp.]